MKPIDTKELSDEQIVNLVQCFDRQGLPLSRRFEGDDQVLRDFVLEHDVKDLAGNMSMILVIILREATIRGIIIPPVN